MSQSEEISITSANVIKYMFAVNTLTGNETQRKLNTENTWKVYKKESL
jgi:hypothetical protein